jgi:tRNA-binding EMAP/Myf-like protein
MKEEEMKHGTLSECMLCSKHNPKEGFCRYRTLGSGCGCKSFQEIDRHVTYETKYDVRDKDTVYSYETEAKNDE